MEYAAFGAATADATCPQDARLFTQRKENTEEDEDKLDVYRYDGFGEFGIRQRSQGYGSKIVLTFKALKTIAMTQNESSKENWSSNHVATTTSPPAQFIS